MVRKKIKLVSTQLSLARIERKLVMSPYYDSKKKIFFIFYFLLQVFFETFPT